MSLATVLRTCNFIKKRLQDGCVPVNVPVNVPRNTFFHRTTLVAAFELCFSIRKEFFKKKVSGEIAFELISLFRVQIQEPTSRSTTTTAFVFLAKYAEFYYHKVFETRTR